ncbi:Hint domain-containing protein [Algicella marina]|nr:Hint domain-containing protein [Algicella marina]
MPSVLILDPSSVTISGGNITITDTTTSVLNIDDNDDYFDGDADGVFGGGDTVEDITQQVSGEYTYIETAYTFENNGVTQTIYAIEAKSAILGGTSTLVGYAVGNSGTPLVAGGPVSFSSQDIGFVAVDPIDPLLQITFDGATPPEYGDLLTCFTAGTMIETAQGPCMVEDLEPGDLIKTADNGYQPLRWIGQTTVAGQGAHAPVLFRKGALGNTRDLLVSQNHRMMLTGSHLEALFSSPDALVAARHLVNDSSIRVVPHAKVTYMHLLFDSHEVIFAEGIPSESFHPGAAEDAISDETRDEILSLFPELAGDLSSYGPSARRTLTALEAAAFL